MSRQPGALTLGLRRSPRQQLLAEDRDTDPGLTQVAGPRASAAAHDKPSPVLVEVEAEMVQPRVGQLGVSSQPPQCAVELEQPCMAVHLDLAPVQLGARE